MTYTESRQLSVISCALGDELRRARQQRGWSRKQLLTHLWSDISIQTVATYESGTRQCTVTRLVELCEAMGVFAHDLLARVHERVYRDTVVLLQLDLDRVVVDQRPELAPLRRWAHQRLAHARHHELHAVPLDLAALESMADLCGVTTVDLMNQLRQLDVDAEARGAS